MHDNKLLLERFSAGEIDGAEARLVEEHCAACGECSDYLKMLSGERQRFLAAHPFPRFNRAAAPGQPWHAKLRDMLRRPSLVPAYGLIALLLMLSPMLYVKVFVPSGGDIAFKGGDGLSFLLQRNGRVSACTPRDTLFPGDRLQVLYSLSKTGHVSLLSVDSRGALSWYQPDRQSPFCSVPVKPGINQGYPAGILLDDSPGQELIIALFSKNRLSKESVQTWVDAAYEKSHADLTVLKRELDAIGGKIKAAPFTALFQKGT